MHRRLNRALACCLLHTNNICPPLNLTCNRTKEQEGREGAGFTPQACVCNAMPKAAIPGHLLPPTRLPLHSLSLHGCASTLLTPRFFPLHCHLVAPRCVSPPAGGVFFSLKVREPLAPAAKCIRLRLVKRRDVTWGTGASIIPPARQGMLDHPFKISAIPPLPIESLSVTVRLRSSAERQTAGWSLAVGDHSPPPPHCKQGLLLG